MKEKIKGGKPGDYIVTEQSGTISVLFIRALKENILTLEEISAPADKIKPSKISWQDWINKGAPLASAWTLYELDVNEGKLQKCYSFLQKKWIRLDDSEYFFGKLITLPLTKVQNAERKKIGAAPLKGEEDVRSPWNPPHFVNGQKKEKPTFEAFKTHWPKDKTDLSECALELYFDEKNKTFPFPYWLEVKGGHYTFKMRTLDSGSGLTSSKK